MSKNKPSSRNIESSKQMLFERFRKSIERFDIEDEIKSIFLRQIVEDFERAYIPIDFKKNASIHIFDKKMVLNNFSRGIQYHEQLDYYVDHFNKTLQKLAVELRSNESFLIKKEELDFYKDEYTSFGRVYSSPFRFQGDLTHSRATNMNWHSTSYLAPHPIKPLNRDFGSFCMLVRDSGVLKQGDSFNKTFVNDVFKKFELVQLFGLKKVPEKVAKEDFRDFGVKEGDLEGVEEKILPYISEKERGVILSYIQKEYRTDKK